jgi:hypothetical protein
MSAIPINSNIQFMDDEKREVIKKISNLMEMNSDAYYRVKSILQTLGMHFLEEMPINPLKFMLKLEDAWCNDTIGNVLIDEGVKRGFI